MIDPSTDYENESAEMSRAQPPVDLTPDLWILKLILGAIDPSYDTKDEKTQLSGGPGGPPPQGQYGAPGGYGPPPGMFSLLRTRSLLRTLHDVY